MTATSPFAVIDTSGWKVDSLETIGDDEKVWLLDDSRTRWLFKPITVKDGWTQGEDWSERITCEVARMMRLPTADIELATNRGRRGCISKYLVPDEWEMQPGAVELSGFVEGYESRAKGRPGHNLDNIEEILRSCDAPPDAELPGYFGGFDTFVGYLLFDAIVANCDRHDENWALLRRIVSDDPPSLAPSYDHANSLGFNLRDADRQRRLDQGAVRAWAEKGRALRFEHASLREVPTLVQLAADALTRVSADAREYWRHSVTQITDHGCDEALEATSVLSDPERRFASEVLRINRGRVLDGCW